MSVGKMQILVEGKSRKGRQLTHEYGGVWIIIEEDIKSPLNKGKRASYIIALEDAKNIWFGDWKKTALHCPTWRIFKWDQDKDLRFICEVGKYTPPSHGK